MGKFENLTKILLALRESSSVKVTQQWEELVPSTSLKQLIDSGAIAGVRIPGGEVLGVMLINNEILRKHLWEIGLIPYGEAEINALNAMPQSKEEAFRKHGLMLLHKLKTSFGGEIAEKDFLAIEGDIRSQAMELIRRQIANCSKCDLSKARTHVVPGEGPLDAQILLIGEGPGAEEDKTGKPFVGSAGNFLSELINIAGLIRENLFITNVVKCRPPGNRTPTSNEVLSCMSYLQLQVNILKPKLIALLGATATSAFFLDAVRVSKHHGTMQRELSQLGYNFFITYHPAAALHNPELKSVLEQDFRNLAAYLKGEEVKLEEDVTSSVEPIAILPTSVEPEPEADTRKAEKVSRDKGKKLKDPEQDQLW